MKEVQVLTPPAAEAPPARKPLPPWLKKRLHTDVSLSFVRDLLDELRLTTVCQNARCPNLGECFARHTATFMVLGKVCSRACGFCAVTRGQPHPPDPDEPARVAEATRRLGLRHVVVTSVTRDDLPDGGSDHFRRTILALRELPNLIVEVLTPDFRGHEAHIAAVVSAGPTLYNHNVETVPRLYPRVRPQADYRRSLALLAFVKQTAPAMFTKSGLMVGLGERADEVHEAMRDLRAAGCDILTLGQYLRPSPQHLPVERFVPPDEFDEYRQAALGYGFRAVASGPFVRSSYNAEAVFLDSGRRDA